MHNIDEHHFLKLAIGNIIVKVFALINIDLGMTNSIPFVFIFCEHKCINIKNLRFKFK